MIIKINPTTTETSSNAILYASAWEDTVKLRSIYGNSGLIIEFIRCQLLA